MAAEDEGQKGRRATPRGRDAAVLEAEAAIADARQSVAVSVAKLEREISRAIDWREWVRRRPGRCLAVAFGVGLLLGRRG